MLGKPAHEPARILELIQPLLQVDAVDEVAKEIEIGHRRNFPFLLDQLANHPIAYQWLLPEEADVSAYSAAHLDDIAAEKWPYWAPIRHHFDIRAFGINAWRGAEGDEVIKRHTETESGQAELYIVLSGRATFTIGEEEVDAPSGTLVYISDAEAERVAFAKEPGTVVLSIGATEGEMYEPSGWDTSYLTPE